MPERSNGHAWRACVVARLPWVRIPLPPHMFYVYFLRLNNGDIYTGSTEDLRRRAIEHKAGKVDSTKNYLPFVLIGYEAYLSKNDSLRREKYLKTTEGKRFFNQQYKIVLEEAGSSRHSTGRHVV